MAEVPSPEALSTLDYLVYIVGAAVAAVLAWMGKTKKPETQPVATLSGALMDNRAVDPLVARLEALEKATGRLCVLMEQEVSLRVSSAEDARRLEEQKRLAVVVADQVREEIRDELMREIHKVEPAKMPGIRRAPAEKG